MTISKLFYFWKRPGLYNKLEGTPPLIAICDKTTERFKRPSFSVIIKRREEHQSFATKKQNPTENTWVRLLALSQEWWRRDYVSQVYSFVQGGNDNANKDIIRIQNNSFAKHLPSGLAHCGSQVFFVFLLNLLSHLYPSCDPRKTKWGRKSNFIIYLKKLSKIPILII